MNESEIRQLTIAELDEVVGGNAVREGFLIVVSWLFGKIADGGSYTPPQETGMWKFMATGDPSHL
jgi:hypothetical protein